jgi:hypothetical protein
MNSLTKYRWLNVNQKVCFTRKAWEKKGFVSHRKTGDIGTLLIISGGANRNCLVEFEDGGDVVCWANLRKINEE